MFKRFQALKKGVETIKKVAPSVGSALGKKKVDLLKKMGKTQRKSPENFKKAGGDKLKKEILAAETRVKKAIGGMLGFKKKDKKKEKEDSKKGTKPKDLIYKPKKMKRLEELRKELKQDGGPVGRGMEARPRKPQYITRKEKPQYITKKEKPQYITKKSKFITKKKKPVQSESKYITRKEKPKYITRKEKVARPGGKALGGGPRD
tara:strand:- start:11 stop:625 length:615 start_codon:yes stop_codon:yes gene_type:complete